MTHLKKGEIELTPQLIQFLLSSMSWQWNSNFSPELFPKFHNVYRRYDFKIYLCAIQLAYDRDCTYI